MKFYSIPKSAKVLVFDIDNTLYSNKAYAEYQENSQIEKLAERLGKTRREAADMLAAARLERAAKGLPKTSMGGHFLEFGIDIRTIILWREETIHPEEWLSPNPELSVAIAELARAFRLAALTNNPKSIGRASLKALGIETDFETVVGLDDSLRSKPAREPFLAVCAALSTHPSEAISIGDRYDVDIEPALALGMGGVLVEGVGDVVRLPETLGAGA